MARLKQSTGTGRKKKASSKATATAKPKAKTKTKTKTETETETDGRPVRAAKKKAPPPSPGKAGIAPFEGFPKDFLAFFRELAKNNEREWFKANETRYRESVEAPLLSFIAAMDLPLGRFASCFEAIPKRSGGSMFRIYRDVRFGRDKSPYKTNAACQFRHEAGKNAHAPGFYVHLEPKEVFFGGGLWMPAAPELRKVREAIVADPERWTEITRAPAFRRRFGEVSGDALKRPPAGFDPDDPMIEEIKRTSYFALEEADPKEILSPDFAKRVAKSLEALGPFMEFLCDAVGLPYHHDF